MRKLLPIILIVLGIAGGAGAGFFLKPKPADIVLDPCGDQPETEMVKKAPEEVLPEDKDYVKLNNQFVIPVVGDDRVQALVVLSLSVEVQAGQREIVFSREPKLRDVFLQELFNHANTGGFRGAFTNSNNMEVLRMALTEAGSQVLGEVLLDVLITDIARQDT